MWLSSVAEETMICHDLLVRTTRSHWISIFCAFSIVTFHSHGPFPWRILFLSVWVFRVFYRVSTVLLRSANLQFVTVRSLNFALLSSSAFGG